MKKLLIAATILFFTIPAAAQSYNLNYNFKEGNTYLFSEVTGNDITQEMMGNEMKIKSDSRTVTRIVSEKNSDNNIVIIVSMDSAISHTKMPMMDTTMVLDQVINKKMRWTISKKGELLEKEMIDSLNPENQMLRMGQKELMQLFILPEKEVSVGEKWNINKVDTVDMMGGTTLLTSEMEFTLSGSEEKMGYNVLKIPYTSKIIIEGKGKMMGFEFFLEGSGNAKGELYFNPDEGLPVYSEAEQTFDVTMAATGDQNMIIPINQVMKTTRTLVK